MPCFWKKESTDSLKEIVIAAFNNSVIDDIKTVIANCEHTEEKLSWIAQLKIAETILKNLKKITCRETLEKIMDIICNPNKALSGIQKLTAELDQLQNIMSATTDEKQDAFHR